MSRRLFFQLAICVIQALALIPNISISESQYTGVGSCSSSSCHGNLAPKPGMRGDEYAIWSKHDKHSKAWVVLTEKDALRIAEHLGIKDPSHEQQCLNCHATNIPEGASKTDRFTVEDGVGCESCHGPAGSWLKSHTQSGRAHSDNISSGMNDLVPLVNRAQTCLGCHFGTDTQYVNHRLIGAGHPRLSFELDTFTQIAPKHWDHDKDYFDRKGVYSSINAWLVGQVVLSQEIINALQSPVRSRNGIWPELTLFNCFACHHSLSRQEWREYNYSGRPGELRINLSSIRVIEGVLQVVSQKHAKILAKLIQELETAYPEGKAQGTLNRLRELFDSPEVEGMNSQSFNSDEVGLILKKVLQLAASAPYLHFEEAEQLAMGVSSILSQIDPKNSRYKEELSALYDSLKDPKEFEFSHFRDAANQFLIGM